MNRSDNNTGRSDTNTEIMLIRHVYREKFGVGRIRTIRHVYRENVDPTRIEEKNATNQEVTLLTWSREMTLNTHRLEDVKETRYD